MANPKRMFIDPSSSHRLLPAAVDVVDFNWVLALYVDDDDMMLCRQA